MDNYYYWSVQLMVKKYRSNKHKDFCSGKDLAGNLFAQINEKLSVYQSGVREEVDNII